MIGGKTVTGERHVDDDRGQVGAFGESIAVEALKKAGYKILELNYRCKLGEIDIIAKESGALVFVEVKARRSDRFGNPKAAVTLQKRRKVSMVALEYLKRNGHTDQKARFDVVAIRLRVSRPEIEIIRNAFDLAY
jgi:putative endonuclease